jgi:hypothetical protein
MNLSSDTISAINDIIDQLATIYMNIKIKTKEHIIRYFIKPEYTNISELQDMDIDELEQIFYPDIKITNINKMFEKVKIADDLYDFILYISSIIRVEYKNTQYIYFSLSDSGIMAISTDGSDAVIQGIVKFINYVDKLKEDGRIPQDTEIITNREM